MKSNPLKAMYLVLAAVVALGVSIAPGAQAAVRVAGVGANSGNQAANQIFSSGDLAGTITRITEAQFNALTPAQLRASYDVLIITWDSAPSLNVDWTTRLLPYLQAGGGVIFEDPNNQNDLAPAVSFGTYNETYGPFEPYPFPIHVSASVPGLTDGVTNDFVNVHFDVGATQPGFNTFLSGPSGQKVGVYAQIGAGRIVITGPDQDFHGSRGAGGAAGNQYRLLLNEVRWVSTPFDSTPPRVTYVFTDNFGNMLTDPSGNPALRAIVEDDQSGVEIVLVFNATNVQVDGIPANPNYWRSHPPGTRRAEFLISLIDPFAPGSFNLAARDHAMNLYDPWWCCTGRMKGAPVEQKSPPMEPADVRYLDITVRAGTDVIAQVTMGAKKFTVQSDKAKRGWYGDTYYVAERGANRNIDLRRFLPAGNQKIGLSVRTVGKPGSLAEFYFHP